MTPTRLTPARLEWVKDALGATQAIVLQIKLAIDNDDWDTALEKAESLSHNSRLFLAIINEEVQARSVEPQEFAT